jgi:hypothetical protein
MSDIIDEIDRLHADYKNGLAPDGFPATAFNTWPTLRDRLREAERKARAWDAVRKNVHRDPLGDYECRAWWGAKSPTGQIIESALRGEEQSNG